MTLWQLPNEVGSFQAIDSAEPSALTEAYRLRAHLRCRCCRLHDGDHRVQVRAAPDLKLKPNDVLHLDPEPSGWRLFDADGEAIARQDPVADGPKLPELN